MQWWMTCHDRQVMVSVNTFSLCRMISSENRQHFSHSNICAADTLSLRTISYVVTMTLNLSLLLPDWHHSYSRILNKNIQYRTQLYSATATIIPSLTVIIYRQLYAAALDVSTLALKTTLCWSDCIFWCFTTVALYTILCWPGCGFWCLKQLYADQTAAFDVSQLLLYTQLYADQAAAFDVANVYDNIDVWRPRLELSLPCDKCWQRNDKQEWTVDVVSIHENWEESNDLDCLAKSHLVCEYDSVLSEHNRQSTRSHITTQLRPVVTRSPLMINQCTTADTDWPRWCHVKWFSRTL